MASPELAGDAGIPPSGAPPPGDAGRTDRGASPTLPAPPATSPGAPQRAIGRYQLLEELGHGGMGVVWKAWDAELRRVVAVKGLLDEPGASEGQIERFLREARAAAGLRHPGIVPVYDVGVFEGEHYIATGYVEGRTLEVAMRERIPPRQALLWCREIAEALAFAHENGVVHRDVKPANILLDGQGRCFVSDFGLAKEVGRKEDVTALTLSGEVLGTPCYMSPEQGRGEVSTLGPAADQFSLGVVLYELLTGRRPFGGIGMWAILTAIQERDPVRPRAINPAIHRDAETICLKALEKDPRRRYASMRALAEDLGRCLDNLPILARPVGALERLSRSTARHPAIVALGTLALLLAAGIGFYAWRAREADRGRESAESDLAKSWKVSQVLARWSLIAESVSRLEAAHYNHWDDSEAQARVASAEWPAVQAFLDQTADDPASQATARALAGWAGWFAGRGEAALEDLRRARELDPDVPFGSVLEALLLFSVLGARMPVPPLEVLESGAEYGAMPETPEELKRIRARIDDLLRATSGARVWGRESASQFEALLRGMQGLSAGDYAAAEDGISAALGQPDLRAFERGLRFQRGVVRSYRKEFRSAREDLIEVAKVWDRCAALQLHLGRCRYGEALEEKGRGGDPRASLQAAIAAFDLAREFSPGYVVVLHHRAMAYQALAWAESYRGVDARATLRKALRDAQDLRAATPQDRAGPFVLAGVLVQRGKAELSLGLDPSDSYVAAREALDEALRIGGGELLTRLNRAQVDLEIGDARSDRGLDPREAYARGILGIEEALRLDAKRGDAYAMRARALVYSAEWAATHGESAGEGYARALQDADRAVELGPRSLVARRFRADVLKALARAAAIAGGDVRGPLERAVLDLEVALDIAPGDPITLDLRAGALWRLGIAEQTADLDPRPAFRRAAADWTAALARDPDNIPWWPRLGTCLGELAQAEARYGGDPREGLERAAECFAGALRVRPGDPTALLWRGNVQGYLGEARSARGGDAAASFRAAIADYEAIPAGDPAIGQALLCKGTTLEMMGEFTRAVEAIEAASRASASSGRSAEFLLGRIRGKQAMSAGTSWLLDVWLAESALGRKDYVSARTLFERAVEASGDGAGLDPAKSRALAHCRYNLACIDSLLSAGRCSPVAPALLLSESESSRLRDRAFGHLAAAAASGLFPASQISEDADLAPLRADPRWTTILKER